MDSQTVLNGGVNSFSFVEGQTQGFDLSNIPYEVMTFQEEEIIFKEGDLANKFYLVHSGCVKVGVTRKNSRGRTTTNEYLNKLVSPGEYFGYQDFIRGLSHQCYAKAVKNTTIWAYSADMIYTRIVQSSPILKLVLNQLVKDLEFVESTGQLHYLASVQERIAYQIILLADRFGEQCDQGISLNLRLTRNEFAQLAGTINESLSRHLTEFKNDGLIELNGREIIIKDRDGLMQRSGNF